MVILLLLAVCKTFFFALIIWGNHFSLCQKIPSTNWQISVIVYFYVSAVRQKSTIHTICFGIVIQVRTSLHMPSLIGMNYRKKCFKNTYQERLNKNLQLGYIFNYIRKIFLPCFTSMHSNTNLKIENFNCQIFIILPFFKTP